MNEEKVKDVNKLEAELISDLPIPADALVVIKEVAARTEELHKYKQQLHQFKIALMEVNKIKNDINNKKITKILIPTVIGNYIQVNNPSGFKDYIAMLNTKIKQFENSIKGIEVQIEQREDFLYEKIKLCYLHLGKCILEKGLKLPEVKNGYTKC